jgi:hypothetical protein
MNMIGETKVGPSAEGPTKSYRCLGQLLADSDYRAFVRLLKAERKLAHIQSLIDKGQLSWLNFWRLNRVCRQIQKLEQHARNI